MRVAFAGSVAMQCKRDRETWVNYAPFEKMHFHLSSGKSTETQRRSWRRRFADRPNRPNHCALWAWLIYNERTLPLSLSRSPSPCLF